MYLKANLKHQIFLSVKASILLISFLFFLVFFSLTGKLSLSSFSINSFLVFTTIFFSYLFVIYNSDILNISRNKLILFLTLESILFFTLAILYSPSYFFIVLVNTCFCGALLGVNKSLIYALVTAGAYNLLSSIFGYGSGSFENNQFIFFIAGNISIFSCIYFSQVFKNNILALKESYEDDLKNFSKVKNLQSYILNSVGVGVITLDEFKKVITINDFGKKLLFMKPTDVSINSKNQEDKDSDDFSCAVLENSKKLKKSERLEVEFNKKIFLCDLKNIEIDEYKKGVICSFSDITRVKLLEDSLRQSDKLSAVGQVAAGIAHEIRNPLASISGSIQLLNSVLDISGEQEKKLIKISLKEIDRLNNMITEFLDFVKPTNVNFIEINFSSFLNEILDFVFLDKKLRSDIFIEKNIQESCVVKGDEDKLKQAVLNIIINACQAMDDVKLPTLKINLVKNEDSIELRVKDNGSGIDSKTKERMFEPFLSTKPKGTGLGLAVTYRILEVHKATIAVESDVGIGTEFILTFPLIN